MSATTMAVATTTETVDPPGSRPGQAALPVSIAAMPVHATGVMPLIFSWLQVDPCQFKQVNNDLNSGANLVA
jgi:hypothetical protein